MNKPCIHGHFDGAMHAPCYQCRVDVLQQENHELREKLERALVGSEHNLTDAPAVAHERIKKGVAYVCPGTGDECPVMGLVRENALAEAVPKRLLDALEVLTGPDNRFDHSIEPGPERDELQAAYDAWRAAPAPSANHDLVQAARDLLEACQMDEHNEAILHGKPGKAWSGDFVRTMRLGAMERVRSLTGTLPASLAENQLALVPMEIDRSKHRAVLDVWNACVAEAETLEMTWPKLVRAMSGGNGA